VAFLPAPGRLCSAAMIRDASASPSRILVRAPNPVGDIVMATASFADIRRTYPAARISVLLRPGREGLLEGSEFWDEWITDDSARSLLSHLRLARRLRRERFDLAILFTNSLRAASLAALARIPIRIGFRKGGQQLLLTRVVEPVLEGGKWLPMPMPQIYARLCEAAGVTRGDGRPTLGVSAELEEEARRRRRELGIASGEELIGIAPGASFGASKLWPVERFAEVADRLTEMHGLRTIIFAGPGEEEIAGRIAAEMKARPISTAASPLGLGLLKPFIRDLKLMVATDSGPRHLAAAFRVPTVVVIGPTDPRWSAVDGETAEVIYLGVDCAPCHLPRCPIDHRCMTGISAADVLERVSALDRRLGIFGSAS
ncbi:MAG: lipopolysaccharide heptosyltransferase II, partial [Planctomycetes bacterium]|nr:lipopolysaccharide heptosyltransferase II [Planctomycetota bacterium]